MVNTVENDGTINLAMVHNNLYAHVNLDIICMTYINCANVLAIKHKVLS